MLNTNKEIYCRRPAWTNAIEVCIAVRNISSGQIEAAKPLLFERVGEGAIAEPTIRLTPEEAQRFIDELWSCGVRPSEGTGSAGSLAATQKHLDDMRAIASHTLGVKL